MTPEEWLRLRPILDELLDRAPEDRAAELERACASDASLRAEVEALLEAESRAGGLLDEPVTVYAPALVRDLEADDGREMDDRRLGPHRLVRVLARGGMAVVYLAERDDGQFTQRVAVKLLRHGVESEEVVRRFLTERQILASLAHPNIARLIDGGIAPGPKWMRGAGLPYLVMEYVEGQPLDVFVRARHLTIPERLELFVTVTRAVHYAHQNLIVHRDLKPSNILVTSTGEVKLLDFGIAKLLEENDYSTEPTRTMRWMTPDYAAPEQVAGRPITTATDVYQLGVVLYQLLTGRTPFASAGRGLLEVEHATMEEQPAKPSGVVGPDAPFPGRALRGDLDAIVLKALRKEPERRYASAADLGDDLTRYLTGHAVTARHGSRAYAASKFAQRHRWGIGVAAAALVVLVTYAATVTIHDNRVHRILAQVRIESDKAKGATAFLMGLFAMSEPGESLAESLTVKELLERGERRSQRLSDQPLSQAQMLDVLGTIYESIELYDRAQPLLERALTTRLTTLGDEHPDVAESFAHLATLLRRRGAYDRARELYWRAVRVQEHATAADPRALAENLYFLSRIEGTRIDDALALNRRAVTVLRERLGPSHPRVAEEMAHVAELLRIKGDHREAEALLRDALAIRQRAFGQEHTEVARSLSQLASLQVDLGALDKAEPLLREALSIRRKVLGSDHPDVTGALVYLADVLEQRGKPDEAEPLLREALAIEQRVYGASHTKLRGALGSLARVLEREGKLAEAESVRRQELALQRALYGPEHTHVAGSMGELALLLHRKGDDRGAERMLREAIAMRTRILGPDHQNVATLIAYLGRVRASARDYAVAESLYVRALSIYRGRGLTERARTVQAVHEWMAALYEAWGKPSRAAEHRALLITPGA